VTVVVSTVLVSFGSLSSVEGVKSRRFIRELPRPNAKHVDAESSTAAPPLPPYETNWFTQTLDHFNYENTQV